MPTAVESGRRAAVDETSRNIKRMRTPVVTSDTLPALRRALSQNPGVMASLDAPRLRVVVDANVILRELHWIIKKRRDVTARSHFREIVDAGVLVPYAPPDLEREVVSHLESFSARRKIRIEVLHEGWRELRGLIKWVLRDPSQSMLAGCERSRIAIQRMRRT